MVSASRMNLFEVRPQMQQLQQAYPPPVVTHMWTPTKVKGHEKQLRHAVQDIHVRGFRAPTIP
jgi:hypothetical protein